MLTPQRFPLSVCRVYQDITLNDLFTEDTSEFYSSHTQFSLTIGSHIRQKDNPIISITHMTRYDIRILIITIATYLSLFNTDFQMLLLGALLPHRL